MKATDVTRGDLSRNEVAADLTLLRIDQKYLTEVHAQLRRANVLGSISMLQPLQARERKLYRAAARACHCAATTLQRAGLGAVRVGEERMAPKMVDALQEMATLIEAKAGDSVLSEYLPSKYMQSEARYLFSKKRVRPNVATQVIRRLRWTIDAYARASGVSLGKRGTRLGATHGRNVVAARWATRILGYQVTKENVATACSRAGGNAGQVIDDPWLGIEAKMAARHNVKRRT